MAEAKKLIIEALANARGISDLSKAVKALTRDAADLGKVLGKINIGGVKGPTDQNAITKQFDVMLKKLREVGVVTKDTAKILGETMGRAIDGERQKLKDLTAAIKETEEQYKSAKDRYSQFTQALKNGRDVDGTTLGGAGVIRMRERQQEASDEAGLLGKRQAEQVGEANRISQNLSGGGNGWIRELASSLAPKLSVGLFATQAVRQMMNIPEGLNRMDQMYLANQSSVNSIYGGMQAAGRSGNLSYALAVRQILSDPSQREEFMKVKDPKSGRYLFQAYPRRGRGRGQGQPQRHFAGHDWHGCERRARGVQDDQQPDPERPARPAGARLAGRSCGPGRWLLPPVRNAGGRRLACGRLPGGFSMDLFQQITGSIIGRGGREARGLGGIATRGTGSGLDAGMLATLAGAANVGGGASALIDHLLTGSAPGGGMNLAAGNLIGRYVAENFSGGAGYTDGSALMAALSVGTGGGRGAANAQNNIAGLGGIQALMSGSMDGFQRGRNLVTALNVLGPGGSLEGAQSLASDERHAAHVRDPQRQGHVSRAMAAMGITTEARATTSTRPSTRSAPARSRRTTAATSRASSARYAAASTCPTCSRARSRSSTASRTWTAPSPPSSRTAWG
jgi:hypothetical protein